MHRIASVVLALSVALFAAACDNNSTSPTNPSTATTVRMTAPLLPANEVPPITNAEAGGTGSVIITWHLTRDASNNITSASADFTIALSGFPPNTSVIAAHIHPGAVGVNGGVLVSTGLASGEFVLNGSGLGTITKTVNAIPADQAQAIINSPANYYFNVHSPLNGSGFARGQLTIQ
jgi:hypothetical protein